MIKKIQPVVEKKIQPEVVSHKLQAASSKRQAIQPVVVWITLRKI